MTKVQYACRTCGTTDVVWDAWASWNPETQQNELHSSFDDAFCMSCESETRVNEVPYVLAGLPEQ